MGELNSHQIARIILKMRYETATEEEKRVLEAWMKAGKGRQTIYDRIVSDESLKEYRDLKAEFDGATDYGKLQSDILGTLAKRDRQRTSTNLLVGRKRGCRFVGGVSVRVQVCWRAAPGKDGRDAGR